MTLRLTRWRGWRGRAFALALALALTPLPAAASEALPSTPALPRTPAAPSTVAAPAAKATSPVSLKESAARAAVRTPLASASRARGAAQGTAGKDTPGFFKTKGGAIALAVMAIGVGYTLYSVKHDRITSPAKQ